MKPIYFKETFDVKGSEINTWIKRVYIFGIKVGEWNYTETKNNDKIGFNNK